MFYTVFGRKCFCCLHLLDRRDWIIKERWYKVCLSLEVLCLFDMLLLFWRIKEHIYIYWIKNLINIQSCGCQPSFRHVHIPPSWLITDKNTSSRQRHDISIICKKFCLSWSIISYMWANKNCITFIISSTALSEGFKPVQTNSLRQTKRTKIDNFPELK